MFTQGARDLIAQQEFTKGARDLATQNAQQWGARRAKKFFSEQEDILSYWDAVGSATKPGSRTFSLSHPRLSTSLRRRILAPPM